MNNDLHTNIKLLPNKNTYDNICKILDANNITHNDFTNDTHSTIIYSPDIVDIKNIKLPEIKMPIIGKNAHFEYFETKDDGIVLVIEFESDIAKKLFHYLKQEYKFTTKYNDFRPHITIQKNIDKKTPLPKIDFDLVFDELKMEIK